MLCGFCNFKFVGAKLERFLDNISIFLLLCGRIESNYLMKIKIAAETSNSFEIDSENNDESKKHIAEFQIQLAMLEDIKDEALMGFRRQEDLKDSNL